jgi:hypothetical protein
MLLALLFLLLDFLSFALMQQWFLYLSLVYLIHLIVLPNFSLQSPRFYTALICFLLVDFAMYGRFGLGLAFIVIAITLTKSLKPILLRPRFTLTTLWIILFFLFENFIINPYMLSLSNSMLTMTLKIVINLLFGYVLLQSKLPALEKL